MRKSWILVAIIALFLPAMFLGCSGDDGSQGAPGVNTLALTSDEPAGINCANGGLKIETGVDDNRDGILDPAEVDSTSYVCNGASAASDISPESCSVCHNGNLVRDGFTHQELYDELYQAGVIVVTNLAYANDNVSDIVTFNLTKNGQPFDCTELDAFQDAPVGTGSSLGIYFTEYTAASRSFDQPAPLTGRLSIGNSQSSRSTSTLSYDAGTNLCTSTKAQTAAGDLSALNGLIVVYGRNEARNAEEESPELRFTRVVQAKYPIAALLETGAGVDYVSAANVAGCERCHTVPFLKHGYIMGDVGGDEFYTCKACHLDNGSGGHEDWQVLVDNPQRAASLLGFPPPAVPLTPAEEAQYAYRTRLMNDVHMSHAMEFPYPMSMANCVACHEGKLETAVLTDANFTAETCKSCHPVTGGTDTPRVDSRGRTVLAVDTINNPKQAPPLTKLWADANVSSFHNITQTCNVVGCHAAGGNGETFSQKHTGYDTSIYGDAIGTKYSSAITASIDSASYDSATNQLTIAFSSAGSLGGLDGANIAPTVLVGLYGYDTKDWLVGPHERDFDDNGDGTVNRNDQRNLEYVVGATHPRFTTVSAAPGSWEVMANLVAWDNLITSGKVKRVEIAVLPRLRNPALDNAIVALNAPSRTFDLGANAFVDNYFSGTNALVKVEGGCNNCHDALADTFHSPDRGGNIVVCRLCHITKDAGSHLEMQSRSIDSYAHGIHSFQPFDINEVDFNDPVEALHYEDHIKFAFPTLGRTNCEACHNAGKYNVPDQSKTLGGVLSASEFPIIFKNLVDFPDGQRNIGEVPSYVAGPAARACGGCHRVNWINEDAAGELAAFYSHTETFGYLVETTSATHNEDVLEAIDTIMGIL